MTTDRELEGAEIELLTALAQVRDARKRLAAKAGGGYDRDAIRKSRAPVQIDVGGRAYLLQTDGSYKPVATGGPSDGMGARHPAAPVPTVTVSGQGGGRQAAAEEDQAVAVIKRLRVTGHIPLRPVA